MPLDEIVVKAVLPVERAIRSGNARPSCSCATYGRAAALVIAGSMLNHSH
jgi:hypothetical protein